MADTTIHAADIERMLADNLRQREQIADRLRERIAALEGELPRLQGMLASIEECGGVIRIESAPTEASPETIDSMRRSFEKAAQKGGGL